MPCLGRDGSWPRHVPKGWSAVEEAADRALRFVAEHREREPVARVADGLVPRDVTPPVQLLLRVPRRLGQLARELLDPLVDDGVELGARERRG